MRRDAARAASQTAATQVTAAEAAKAMADKKVADTAALVKTTAAAKTAADAAAADAATKSHSLDSEKTAAEQRARQANEAAQPRDYTLVLYSNPLVLQVDPRRSRCRSPRRRRLAHPGEKVELPLTVERKFGFTTNVDAGIVSSPNTSGLHSGDITIQSGQTKGTLVVQLDPQIKPGEYNVTIRARMNFNGQPCQMDQPVTIKVEAVEKKVERGKKDKKVDKKDEKKDEKKVEPKK